MLSYFNILTMLSFKYKTTWQQYFPAETPNIKISTNPQHFCKNIKMKKVVKKEINPKMILKQNTGLLHYAIFGSWRGLSQKPPAHVLFICYLIFS